MWFSVHSWTLYELTPHRQIYLAACGHNHAEYRQTSQNDFGLTVHGVLADHQDEPNGCDGTAVQNGAFVGPDDSDPLAFCLAGPGVPPALSAPYVAESCLAAFDADSDLDVDAEDVLSLLLGAEPPQVPTAAWTALLAAVAMSMLGRRRAGRALVSQ